MIFPVSPHSGTANAATLSSSSGTEPHSSQGRNLPHRLEVLSTNRPAARSAIPSQMRTTRKIVPAAVAEIPATSV